MRLRHFLWILICIAVSTTAIGEPRSNPSNCGTCDDYPVARVGDFVVINGRAMWTVLSELRTAEYILEGCDSLDGLGTFLISDVSGLGDHSVSLPPSEYPMINLIEVDSLGWRTKCGVARADLYIPQGISSRSSPSPSSMAGIVQKKILELDQRRAIYEKSRPENTSQLAGSPDYVIFTLDSLLDIVESYVANYWESKGYVPAIIDVSPIPYLNRISYIKSKIAEYDNLYGTKYFHIIGAPDLPNFTIPYYCSEQEYGDLDDDGIPEVTVTRWPLESAQDLIFMCDKMQDLNSRMKAEPYTAALFMGDVDLEHNSGANVRGMGGFIESLILDLAPDRNITKLFWSDFNGDGWARDDSAASRINRLKPELLWLLGTQSDQVQTIASFFSLRGRFMQELDPGSVMPLVIGASCYSGMWFWHLEEEFLHRARADSFLWAPDRGTIAWVGPADATLQKANYMFSRYFLEELYSNAQRPMAESWLIAVQRAHEYFEGNQLYLDAIDSYTFLGDPLY